MNKKHVFEWKQIFIPVLIALGTAFRFIGVSGRTLDGDEGVILKIANGSVSHVIAGAAQDVHPPFFHLLVSLSLTLFGSSALALRLVSVLAGIGVVALGPAIARRLKANEVLVTALLATAPFLVYVSQDARMYSLLMFLVVAGWVLLMDLWENPTEFRTWAIWGLVSAMMVLTHHLGWVVLAGELVATLILHRELFTKTRHWIGVGALILASYLCQASTTWHQVTGRLAEQSTSAGWSARGASLVGALYRFVAGRTFLNLNPHALVDLAGKSPALFVLFLLSFAIPTVLLIVGVIHLVVTDRKLFWTLLVLGGVPFLAAVLVGSVAVQAPRYLSFLAPFGLAVLAIGLSEVWSARGMWGKIIAFALAGIFVAGLWTQLAIHDTAPGLNAYAEQIINQGQAGDVVLIRGAFAGGEVTAYEFERDHCMGQTSCVSASLVSVAPVVDMYGDYAVGNLTQLKSRHPADLIESLLKNHQRVWFFDQTYGANPLSGLAVNDQVTQYNLGKDKEQQTLALYLITR